MLRGDGLRRMSSQIDQKKPPARRIFPCVRVESKSLCIPGDPDSKNFLGIGVFENTIGQS